MICEPRSPAFWVGMPKRRTSVDTGKQAAPFAKWHVPRHHGHLNTVKQIQTIPTRGLLLLLTSDHLGIQIPTKCRSLIGQGRLHCKSRHQAACYSVILTCMINHTCICYVALSLSNAWVSLARVIQNLYPYQLPSILKIPAAASSLNIGEAT